MKIAFNPACKRSRIPTSHSPWHMKVKFEEMKTSAQFLTSTELIHMPHDILYNEGGRCLLMESVLHVLDSVARKLKILMIICYGQHPLPNSSFHSRVGGGI